MGVGRVAAAACGSGATLWRAAAGQGEGTSYQTARLGSDIAGAGESEHGRVAPLFADDGVSEFVLPELPRDARAADAAISRFSRGLSFTHTPLACLTQVPPVWFFLIIVTATHTLHTLLIHPEHLTRLFVMLEGMG